MTSAERPHNHPIYSLDTKLGSTIFFSEGSEDSYRSQNVDFVPTWEEQEGVWEVIFDGAVCTKGARDGVWVRPLGGRDVNYSYKLAFDCTNNESKYESMVLAIQILKDFQVRRVVIHGGSELVTKQMIGEYQARHPRLRSYINDS